jgi:hypothetical protein
MGCQIDDAQPAVSECDTILHERAAGIRPARIHLPGHCRNATTCSVTIEGQLTANTAHFLFQIAPHAQRTTRAALDNVFGCRGFLALNHAMPLKKDRKTAC